MYELKKKVKSLEAVDRNSVRQYLIIIIIAWIDFRDVMWLLEESSAKRSGDPRAENFRVSRFLCFEGHIFSISASRNFVSLILRNGTFSKILSHDYVSDALPQSAKYLHILMPLSIWSWSFWVSRAAPGNFSQFLFYDILGVLEGVRDTPAW